ncbi:MAG: hypothetical protein ACI4J5_07280 [Oscillospiraceae bacterium]
MDYIYDSDMLEEKLAEKEGLSKGAKAYIYLTWLGLSAAEIKAARYNGMVSTVEWDDRMTFVKDEKISAFLSSCVDISDFGKYASEAENSGIEPGLVYKMGFFNIRYEQKKLGQPEDVVRIREMAKVIGEDASALSNEYLDYEKGRNAIY